jgi:hypothetical protein
MFRHRNEYPSEGELPAFDGATTWVLVNGSREASEFLVEFAVDVPDGTPETEVEERRRTGSSAATSDMARQPQRS